MEGYNAMSATRTAHDPTPHSIRVGEALRNSTKSSARFIEALFVMLLKPRSPLNGLSYLDGRYRFGGEMLRPMTGRTILAPKSKMFMLWSE